VLSAGEGDQSAGESVRTRGSTYFGPLLEAWNLHIKHGLRTSWLCLEATKGVSEITNPRQSSYNHRNLGGLARSFTRPSTVLDLLSFSSSFSRMCLLGGRSESSSERRKAAHSHVCRTRSLRPARMRQVKVDLLRRSLEPWTPLSPQTKKPFERRQQRLEINQLTAATSWRDLFLLNTSRPLACLFGIGPRLLSELPS